MIRVEHVREIFWTKLRRKQFAPNDMLEIVACQFLADEPAVFGTPNDDWHARELAWYRSMSLNVRDIPPPIPSIWEQVASHNGEINSNYGWCIFSEENGHQFWNAVEAIKKDPATRQAIMIYTRPSMHGDAVRDGMRDFMCTNTVQLILREGKLDYLVNMRSSDAVFGYKGDSFWNRWVHEQAIESLRIRGVECEKGRMVWNAGSFHVYPRHHHLVREWAETGDV